MNPLPICMLLSWLGIMVVLKLSEPNNAIALWACAIMVNLWLAVAVIGQLITRLKRNDR